MSCMSCLMKQVFICSFYKQFWNGHTATEALPLKYKTDFEVSISTFIPSPLSEKAEN